MLNYKRCPQLGACPRTVFKINVLFKKKKTKEYIDKIIKLLKLLNY